MHRLTWVWEDHKGSYGNEWGRYRKKLGPVWVLLITTGKKKDNYNLRESASSHAFLRMSVVNWSLCESRYQVWDQSSRSILGSTLRIHASKTQEEKADLEGAEAESQCSSNKGLKQACGCPVPHGDQSLTQAAPGREQNCGEGRWLRAIPERTESHSSALMEGLQWYSTVSINLRDLLQRYRQD